MELSDLYSDRIIEIAGSLRDLPPLEQADCTSRRTSRICGSVVEVSVKVADGVVSGYSHRVSACALGQTSAAIMAGLAVGSTPDELRLVRTQMYEMLKSDGPPPAGKWEDLKYLEPVRSYPARHTSTLLVFDAVVDCLDRIQGVPAG